ncbi:MAG: tetratricopeptide repeat protein [Pseudomonadaceae bacterium]|nr:tetratricopeptide repeat protein [Pseudomonadaceae bacterium]
MLSWERISAEMTRHGLRNQSALVEAIRAIEGTEEGPRATISRVKKRAHPVDLATAERIAVVFDIAAEELIDEDATDAFYRQSSELQSPVGSEAFDDTRDGTPAETMASEIGSAEDSERRAKKNGEAGSEPATTDNPAIPNTRPKGLLTWGAIAALILLAALVTILNRSANLSDSEIAASAEDEQPSKREPAQPSTDSRPDTVELRIGSASQGLRPTVGFRQPVGTLSEELSLDLQRAFTRFWNHLPNKNWLPAGEIPSEVDIALSLTTRLNGRYVAISISGETNYGRQLLWTDIAHRAAPKEERTRFANRAADAINDFLVGNGQPEPVAPDQILKALGGLEYTDGARSESSVLRSKDVFRDLVDSAPDWHLSHLGLCGAFASEFMWKRKPEYLATAEVHCDRARDLRPDYARTFALLAFIKSKRNEAQNARELLNQALELSPRGPDVNWHMGLHALERYQRDQTEENLESARRHLENAVSADQSYWKYHFSLSRLSILEGKYEQALEHSSNALSLEDNYLTLNNSAIASYCMGNYDDAIAKYTRVQSLQPDEFAGYYNLGTAYYAQGRFNESAEQFAQALSTQHGKASGDHRLNGVLADAYRYQGKDAAAIDLYRRALTMAETLINKGSAHPTHLAHRAYYHAALISLGQSDVIELDDLIAELSKLSKQDKDLFTWPKIASAWVLIDRIDDAIATYRATDQECLGMLSVPELQTLKSKITQQ